MTELNIGGSNMTVELRGDINTLYAEANTGNKQWVAVITDTHPKYNYDRDFVAYQKPKTSDRDSGTASVEGGAVIERVRYTHSGKNRKDQFYQLVDGEVYQIDEVDVEAALNGEIVPDIEPETHECDECGDEFDSEHGVAVHKGMAHSGDEADTSADGGHEVVADGGQDPETEQFADEGDRVRVDFESAIDGELSVTGTVGVVEQQDAQTRYEVERDEQHDIVFYSGVDSTGYWTAVYRLVDDDESWYGDEAYLDVITSDDDEIVADGGEMDIRDSREVRNSDDQVRYVNNPDGTLYAYREGDDHVVVSRGNEPGTRWTKRVSAERTAVASGEQLWTIPDNWERRASIDGAAERYYGIYHIPGTDVDVLLTIPKNSHLVDKWFSVKRVGQLEVTYDDEIAWTELAKLVEQLRDIDEVETAVVDGLEQLHARCSEFEGRFAEAVNMYAEEAVFERNQNVPPTIDDWTIEPWGDTFEIEVDLRQTLDVDDETLDAALTELNRENIVPRYPRVRVDVAEGKGLPEQFELRGMIQAGCSPPEAVDYLMTEAGNLSQTEWAEERGKAQPSVSKNVKNAKRSVKA